LFCVALPKQAKMEQTQHTVTEKGKQFLGSLPPRDRELHELAAKMLGSSYFVEKTHAFTKWLKSTPNTQSPAAK
jgi:hypothetical protein